MNRTLWDMLENLGPPGVMDKLSAPLKQRLHDLSNELAPILTASEIATQTDILSKLCAEILCHISELETAVSNGDPKTWPEPRPVSTQIPPEVLEWAKNHFDEEETLAGIREIRETGGFQLDDFIQELERESLPHE